MIITKMTSCEVKISFEADEIQKIRSMSVISNQTDFLTKEDYISIMLRHAQDVLDNFPECVPSGK